MQAVLTVRTKWGFLVPEATEFKLYTYVDGDCTVTADPPVRLGGQDSSDRFEVDGRPAYMADALRIRFGRPKFDRIRSNPVDPPYDLLNRAVQSLLDRLKYFSRSWLIQPIQLPECAWYLQYLNDDGTELAKEEGLVRGRGATTFSVACVAFTPQLWDRAFELDPEFTPPAWHTLLVDATGALPHVGSAMVLCAAALEVFIAEALSNLAPRSTIPPTLWSWVITRGGDYRKEPSVAEQFSDLLYALCGHSLKDDNRLWESFKNIRDARNSFVHGGVPRIGKDEHQISTAEAKALIEQAGDILRTIREWMPADLRWPMLQQGVQVRVEAALMGIAPSGLGSAS